MGTAFRDRDDAGRRLAAQLADYAGRDDVVVLALPRGGVPVAYQVATALGVPLDVFLVRKLGVPGHEELAMGAIASGGVQVLNREVIRGLGITRDVIEAVVTREAAELERRAKRYRDGRTPPPVAGRTTLLIDDGLATGSTMRAAVRALRRIGPAQVVVAVPVAAAETCAALRQAVDRVICALTPEPFLSVGRWYEDFEQTSDAEVQTLLTLAGRQLPSRARAAGT